MQLPKPPMECESLDRRELERTTRFKVLRPREAPLPEQQCQVIGEYRSRNTDEKEDTETYKTFLLNDSD